MKSIEAFFKRFNEKLFIVETLKQLFLIFSIFIILVPKTWANETSTPQFLTFAVVPQQSASKLAMQWGPLLQEVSHRSGISLRFRTAPDIPEFEKRLSQSQYDFAYMNPYHYAVFHKIVGYKAFGKAKDGLLQGIIVVHKDSPYQSLKELTGQTLVFPSPAAFAATILTQNAFAEEKIDINPIYVASHDSVYRAVASQRYVAGGGIMRTLNAMDETIQKQLRILEKTKVYTSHPFAAHPRIKEEIVEKIRDAFVSLANDEIGRKLLAPLKLNGIIPAEDTDWDDVRALKINRLQYFPDQTKP